MFIAKITNYCIFNFIPYFDLSHMCRIPQNEIHNRSSCLIFTSLQGWLGWRQATGPQIQPIKDVHRISLNCIPLQILWCYIFLKCFPDQNLAGQNRIGFWNGILELLQGETEMLVILFPFLKKEMVQF